MLFGHQNHDDTQQPVPDAHITPAAPPLPPPPTPDPTPAPVQDHGYNPLAVDSDTGASLPTAPMPSLDRPDEPEPSVLDQPAPTFHHAAPVPAIDTVNSGSGPQTYTPAPAPEPVDQHQQPAPHPHTATPAAPLSSDDLLNLKQQALSQLSPLVSKLEQTPEEKFRTTMMLIQTTDNQALLQEAYHAAQAIPDEKARAQALLDVVNEINYFTQQKHDA